MPTTAAATPRSAPRMPWVPSATRTPALLGVVLPDGDDPEPVAFALVLPLVVDEPPVGDAPLPVVPVLLPLELELLLEVAVATGILLMAVQVPPAK